MHLRRTSPVLLGLVALVGSACSSGGGVDKAAALPVTTTSSTVVESAVAEAVIAPLTGLPDPSGVTAQRPALSVKIDNAPDARPQAGLDVADVVFEEIVEGGITRFIAVFHSNAPKVAGPIRSVRPMDPNILSALHGLVAYSGGIPKFVSMLRRAPVQDVNVDVATPAYSWDKARRAPHNLFASPELLWPLAQGANAEPPKALFEYRLAGQPFGDADVATLRIPYSPRVSASYAWEAASGTWKRTENGTPHLAASGANIAPENLVVQFVNTRLLGEKDQSGSNVVESIVIGAGEAWYLSGGRVTKGQWSKPDASSPTRYVDAAGNPLKLAPGRTWVHFAPVGTPVSTG